MMDQHFELKEDDPLDESDAMVIDEPMSNLSLRPDDYEMETSLCCEMTESDGHIKSVTSDPLQRLRRSDANSQAPPPTSQLLYVRPPSSSDLTHSLKVKVASLDLFIVDLGGSGDCMFRALSHQLAVVCGCEISSRNLRQQVVKYLRENDERLDTPYSDFVVENESWIPELEKLDPEHRKKRRWELYLCDIERENTWGDNICLQAASDMTELIIEVVYSTPNRDNHILKPVKSSVSEQNRLILGHIQEYHYVSVVRSPNSGTDIQNTTPQLIKSHSVPSAISAQSTEVASKKENTNNRQPNILNSGVNTASDAVAFDTNQDSLASVVSLRSSVSMQGVVENTFKHDNRNYFDVFLIYCNDDFDDADKFKELLIKFISPALKRDVTFCMDQMDIPELADFFDFVSAALKTCRWKFIFIGENYDEERDGKMKFLKHRALKSMIDRQDNSIVPIKTCPNVKLPEFLDMFRPIDINRLLNKMSLGDVDIRTLDASQLNSSVLDSIVRMLATENSAPSFYSGTQQKSSVQATRFSAVIQKHYSFLVDHIDPENGLLGELYSRNVISSREMETITKSKTFYDKNEDLLKLIKTKSDADFQKFIAALKSTNQKHVVKLLQSK